MPVQNRVFERCNLLNDNPVLVARQFQYRVETFFSTLLIKSNLIGVLNNYAIRVEYQYRGSPHIHAFLWVSNIPRLDNDTISSWINIIDARIQCTLPDEVQDKELYDLVKTYQTHKHSKSCQKYENISCRYSYGRFFTKETIIGIPLNNELSNIEKIAILNNLYNIMVLYGILLFTI